MQKVEWEVEFNLAEVSMDNLRRLDPEWYTKGMVGETVLMNMEYYLFNAGEPDVQGFVLWADNYGLNKEEINIVLNEANVARSLGEVT